MTKLEVGLEKKHCLHNARKDTGFVSNNPRIELYHNVLQQLSPDKLVAIRFMLASSENFDNMDHLIAEGIEYVKNQEVENLTDENSSSQNNVNYANHELIDSVKDEKDACLTQDLQENVESIQSIHVPTKIIEVEVDDYSIQHSVAPPHEENNQDTDI